MEFFATEVQVRWSDLDPNFHLRHSVYYDWGAFCRIKFLNQHGITPQLMHQYHFGPILFREECIFKKEIRLDDMVSINLTLLKSRRDFSRWSFQHHIFKNEKILAAILTVDGAWIDTELRKLTTLPGAAIEVFEKMPRNENFTWEEK